VNGESSERYEISSDRHRLDISLIHNFLRNSYWSPNIPRNLVEKAISNSLCFGAFCGEAQVGFARVITDYASFGYIADVFVLPEHRGRGVGKLLVRAILDHPELQGLRRLLLATRDAHGLYAPFGFESLGHPEHFLTIHKPAVYQNNNEKPEA
jgi:GNAT superfamily N-acetyltransferase